MLVRIAFVGKPVPNLGYSESSVTMISWCIDSALVELSRTDLCFHYVGAFHARAGMLAASMPPVDLAVIHDTYMDGHDGRFWFPMDELRSRAAVVVLCSESTSSHVDHNFTWRERPFYNGPTTVVPVVAPLGLLAPTGKTASILVDHDWPGAKEKGLGSMDAVLGTLQVLARDFEVGQLARPPCVDVAPWMSPVWLKPYKQYLQDTSAYKVFLMPLRGSYNHSAVDMLARGAHVIALPGVACADLLRMGVREVSPDGLETALRDALAAPQATPRAGMIDSPAAHVRRILDWARRL